MQVPEPPLSGDLVDVSGGLRVCDQGDLCGIETGARKRHGGGDIGVFGVVQGCVAGRAPEMGRGAGDGVQIQRNFSR